MISRDKLAAAPGVWPGAGDQLLADVLPEHEAGVLGTNPSDALAGAHLKLRGGDAEKVFASLAENSLTLEPLARIDGLVALVSLGRVVSGSAQPDVSGDADRATGFAIAATTSYDQRIYVLKRFALGGLGAVLERLLVRTV